MNPARLVSKGLFHAQPSQRPPMNCLRNHIQRAVSPTYGCVALVTEKNREVGRICVSAFWCPAIHFSLMMCSKRVRFCTFSSPADSEK